MKRSPTRPSIWRVNGAKAAFSENKLEWMPCISRTSLANSTIACDRIKCEIYETIFSMHVKHDARTLQETNSTLTKSTLQTPSPPALLFSSPQQTSPFGGQGLATEKQVKHCAPAHYRKPIERLTRAPYKHRARQPYYTPPPNKRPPSVDRG